jgi:phosphoribosylglycinamide formyltransferase-1
MSKSLVFLCSGDGGNLRFTLQAVNRKWINRWEKIVVVADRECQAINFARRIGLDSFVMSFNKDGQNELTQLMLKLDPDLIITTVHSILLGEFLTRFQSRLLNLHYSLLPSFSGLIGKRPVQEALEYGSRIVGVTIHKVIDIVDGGEPQIQIALPLNNADEIEEVMDIIFRAGCIALLIALRILDKSDLSTLLSGHILIKKRMALVSPYVLCPEELNDDYFWETIKV